MAVDFCNTAAFEVEIIYLDCGVEVALRGELDVATVPDLHEQLIELVDRGEVVINLDLSDLRYIDSTGLSLLVTTQKRVTQMGGSLLVRHPTPSTLKIFAVTGLVEILMGADASRHARTPRHMKSPEELTACAQVHHQ